MGNQAAGALPESALCCYMKMAKLNKAFGENTHREREWKSFYVWLWTMMKTPFLLLNVKKSVTQYLSWCHDVPKKIMEAKKCVFNLEKRSHYDEKSMFSFQKVPTLYFHIIIQWIVQSIISQSLGQERGKKTCPAIMK